MQLGAAIYALRVPERWYPGAFDLWFSSHQLFHLCVVAAALVHYGGVRTLLDWKGFLWRLQTACYDWEGRPLLNSAELWRLGSIVLCSGAWAGQESPRSGIEAVACKCVHRCSHNAHAGLPKRSII